jgi:ubiquinone/menaquinone biosynthesis C-methylase UbiE
VYDAYSFRVLPMLGKLVAGGRRQLSVSGRVDPQTSRSGNAAVDDAGCRSRGLSLSHNLTGGIVAVHRGYRL